MFSANGIELLLGVDPGLAATGWGLIDGDHRVVACGTLRTSPGPAAPRLLQIVTELHQVLRAHHVTEAALARLGRGSGRWAAASRCTFTLTSARTSLPSTASSPPMSWSSSNG